MAKWVGMEVPYLLWALYIYIIGWFFRQKRAWLLRPPVRGAKPRYRAPLAAAALTKRSIHEILTSIKQNIEILTSSRQMAPIPEMHNTQNLRKKTNTKPRVGCYG